MASHGQHQQPSAVVATTSTTNVRNNLAIVQQRIRPSRYTPLANMSFAATLDLTAEVPSSTPNKQFGTKFLTLSMAPSTALTAAGTSTCTGIYKTHTAEVAPAASWNFRARKQASLRGGQNSRERPSRARYKKRANKNNSIYVTFHPMAAFFIPPLPIRSTYTARYDMSPPNRHPPDIGTPGSPESTSHGQKRSQCPSTSRQYGKSYLRDPAAGTAKP